MKKLISITLCALMLLFSLAACGEKEEKNLKLGLGLCVASPSATDATEDGNGKAQATVTVAAVTLDRDGRIVDCQLDCADTTVEYTADGRALAKESFMTKHEAGKDYNMVAYGNAAKEWFEQADAFEGVAVGKTVDEVKALVAEGNKGSDEVIKAGCTIMVHEFVKAIEKAAAGAVETEAKSSDALKLGVYTQQTTKDAAEDVKGSNKLETTFFAATVDADGKVTAAATDCIAFEFAFDDKGASTFDTAKAVVSKREQGKNYGMIAYGNATKEWYEQAAGFCQFITGKTLNEAIAIAVNPAETDVITSCTIGTEDFLKLIVKSGL